MNKVIVFEVWGDYAHFRKIYTTTSPLSYPIPPRTALTGLIAAIAGIDKQNYISFFSKDKANIALKIVSPIKKVRITENLIDTKRALNMHIIKTRTQIRFEFIKDPKYRIYFYHSDNNIYEREKKLIKAHQCIYTPYLGLSELLCNFAFIDEFEITAYNDMDKFIDIDSVVPIPYIKEANFDKPGEYFSITMPNEMQKDRIVTKYEEVLFERRGGKVNAKVNKIWELENGEQILFL